MGSSSQFYRDAVSTEGWDNATAASEDSPYWWRELLRPPDWGSLESELRWSWEVHVYGLASLFCVLATLCFFTILRLRSQLSDRPHLHTLNLFLCILATTRFVVLFVDPYGTKETLPVVMLQVAWDLGYPCLVSAFALLQLSFVRMTQVKMSLGSETLVSVVVTFHFCLVITSGVLATLQRSLRIVWLLTQLTFVVWGVYLCLSSLCGCLRLLRSIVKLPLRFLAQVEPGCQINSIMPLGMFMDPPQQEPRVSQQPRIRITDVDDSTFSYVSEASQAANNPDCELSPLRWPSPTHWKPADSKTRTAKPCEDPALVRPLVSDRNSCHSVVAKAALPSFRSAPESLSTLQATPHDLKNSLSRLSSRPTLEEFKFDARKLKSQCRSRLEKLLRRLVATSLLGLILCLLKLYDVFGPHGHSVGAETAAVLPWFCIQTIARVVEFSMAYIMVNISQQSLKSHYYHYPT